MPEKKHVQACDQCGRITDTEAGLCATCLREQICCTSQRESVIRNCGCQGRAARALERLAER